MPAHSKPKILVVRFSSLGDVVLTTPVFEALRNAWPDAELTALTKEAFADVLTKNPNVDRCWTLKSGDSLFALMNRVRDEKFDWIIDLHGSLRSRLICAWAGSARVVRARKAVWARRLYVRWRWPSPELHEHTLDRYLDALRQLGISSAPKSIVVIQTAFLGDAVLTTPLLTAIKEKYPTAKLSIFCTPDVSDVFSRHPAIADVLLFDKRGADRSFRGVLRAAARLRALHFDLAFIPHRSFKSAFLAWWAEIPRRVGFSSSQGRLFLTDVVPFHWGVHDADRNLALLQAVGENPSSGHLLLNADPVAIQSITDRRRAEGIGSGDRVVGVNAGSVWATKRWLPEGFAAVADRLIREKAARVIFFGGPKDRPDFDAVKSFMKEKAIDWVGHTSLRELIAGISSCDVFLTNDSGPMHIAVAAGVPTVAIFGPTTEELGFFPYGPGHLVVQKELDCRPCGLHGAKKCPLGHFHCMKWITPDEVYDAVTRQMDRAGERRI